MERAEQGPVSVIEPSTGLGALRLGDLWEYRELLYFFVWRDLKVRYKQTALGVAWAVLQPLLSMVVFTLFFGKMAGIPSDGLPYPLFSFAGLVVWTSFSQALSQTSNSLVGSAHLITKVYFPRLLIPLASTVGTFVDLLVVVPVLIGLMTYYGVAPDVRVLAAPAFLVLAMVAALGVGLWLAALNVEFRDVRYVLPFLVQLWLFLTPVIYPASIIAPRLEAFGVPGWILGLNPMAAAVEGFRWATLGTGVLPWALVACSAATGAVLLVTGAFYFRSMERSFADVL